MGAYFDFKETVVAQTWGRLESLIGYRYLHYDDSLSMSQTLLPTGAAFIPGTKIQSFDSFLTKNDFNGCEFGFRTELNSGRWSLEILTKMAVGNINREVSITGSTQTSVPGSATTNGVGGVYALSSNIGNHFTSDWVVSPEIGLNLGYQWTSNIRMRLGYSFIYFQDIARAADQIDFTLNQNFFPPPIAGGPNRPGIGFVKSELWMQTINLGMEIRF